MDCAFLEELDLNLIPFEGEQPCVDINADGVILSLDAIKETNILEEISLKNVAFEGEKLTLSLDAINETNIIEQNDVENEYDDKAIKIDLTQAFTTDEEFPTRHCLIDWCQSQGRKMQTIVVTTKSDKGINGRRPRLTLACERSGVYRGSKSRDNVVSKRDSATRKCGCPFSLRGVNIDGDRWKVEVHCGFHNHELPKTLVGHPYCGRLSVEEKNIVVEMTLAGAKPRDILTALKRRRENNASTMKTIYNAKANMKTHEMEGRTAMQQMMKLLVERHYVYWHRKNEVTDEVLDLFWAHPESILLAKCFPSVVIVDCTYKTNKYKMPLFAMVGITSTARTFSIAHCFLYKEVEDNYRWALSKLKMLFAPHDIPTVFVTDREHAVINAVGSVFPDADRMLCTFHI